MPKNGNQARNWLFTLNNPSSPMVPEEWKTVPGVKACVWQLEKAGTTGTPHLQGYLQLEKAWRLGRLRQLCPGAHWEPRCGTHDQARAYCTKEDTRQMGPFEYGTSTRQGQRSDLLGAKAILDGGGTISDVANEHFGVFLRYHRGLHLYASLRRRPRDFKTTCVVIHGPTGTGKSSYVREYAPDAYWMPRGEWFDQYDGQSVVVIDEFYGWMPYDTLLRLVDRYPMLVPFKGGFTSFVARKVYIISNKAPTMWYDAGRCPFPPLCRRFDKVFIKETLDGPMVDDTAALKLTYNVTN